MSSTPSQQTPSASENQAMVSKGMAFLSELKKYSEDPKFKAAEGTAKMTLANLPLRHVGKLNPSRAAFVISAVFIKKGMAAAGIVNKDEAVACVMAVANLGLTVGVATAVAAPTGGVGSFVLFAKLSLDAYQVKSECFDNNGAVSHTVSSR